jgi:hypothetical protein
MKTIFDATNIPYDAKATYSPLMEIAQKEKFFPDIASDKIKTALVNILKGLGEIRNKAGGHGSPDKRATDRLVRLALHHATANMLYIAETYLEEHKRL